MSLLIIGIVFICVRLKSVSICELMFTIFVDFRTTVTYIEKALSDEAKDQWRKRGQVDHIILLDWNSTLSQVTIATPLRTLKDALFKVQRIFQYIPDIYIYIIIQNYFHTVRL